ncbi:Protein ELC-like [Acorus gramineus]|uniref:Protein ELC-like n=1 Tax=Acorus gramineus TaxID=55184 RepID=A0AAV9B0L6_ACOGR|nr:Protein ELC-like [Acorus gramineus]
MALASSSFRFVDAALSTTGPLALSYAHVNLKWLIRDHLLALLADFPSLSPSIASFTHDDGTTVHLLNASGRLPLPFFTSRGIPLTIWLHQDYPLFRPLVYLSPPSPTASTIPHNHPFVDPSGAVGSPYVKSWQYPKSNLSDLVRNLANLLALSPPFVVGPPRSPSPPKRLPSKREAIDRLVAILHRDMASMKAKAEGDIEAALGLQARLYARARDLSIVERALVRERGSLKGRAAAMDEAKDVLVNWLLVNHRGGAIDGSGLDEVFEGEEDQNSMLFVDYKAEELAIEDVMYEMEKGLNGGVVPLEKYMKEVRGLAREEFFVKVKSMKLKR